MRPLGPQMKRLTEARKKLSRLEKRAEPPQEQSQGNEGSSDSSNFQRDLQEFEHLGREHCFERGDSKAASLHTGAKSGTSHAGGNNSGLKNTAADELELYLGGKVNPARSAYYGVDTLAGYRIGEKKSGGDTVSLDQETHPGFEITYPQKGGNGNLNRGGSSREERFLPASQRSHPSKRGGTYRNQSETRHGYPDNNRNVYPDNFEPRQQEILSFSHQNLDRQRRSFGYGGRQDPNPVQPEEGGWRDDVRCVSQGHNTQSRGPVYKNSQVPRGGLEVYESKSVKGLGDRYRSQGKYEINEGCEKQSEFDVMKEYPKEGEHGWTDEIVPQEKFGLRGKFKLPEGAGHQGKPELQGEFGQEGEFGLQEEHEQILDPEYDQPLNYDQYGHPTDLYRSARTPGVSQGANVIGHPSDIHGRNLEIDQSIQQNVPQYVRDLEEEDQNPTQGHNLRDQINTHHQDVHPESNLKISSSRAQGYCRGYEGYAQPQDSGNEQERFRDSQKQGAPYNPYQYDNLPLEVPVSIPQADTYEQEPDSYQQDQLEYVQDQGNQVEYGKGQERINNQADHGKCQEHINNRTGYGRGQKIQVGYRQGQEIQVGYGQGQENQVGYGEEQENMHDQMGYREDQENIHNQIGYRGYQEDQVEYGKCQEEHGGNQAEYTKVKEFEQYQITEGKRNDVTLQQDQILGTHEWARLQGVREQDQKPDSYKDSTSNSYSKTLPTERRRSSLPHVPRKEGRQVSSYECNSDVRGGETIKPERFPKSHGGDSTLSRNRTNSITSHQWAPPQSVRSQKISSESRRFSQSSDPYNGDQLSYIYKQDGVSSPRRVSKPQGIQLSGTYKRDNLQLPYKAPRADEAPSSNKPPNMSKLAQIARLVNTLEKSTANMEPINDLRECMFDAKHDCRYTEEFCGDKFDRVLEELERITEKQVIIQEALDEIRSDLLHLSATPMLPVVGNEEKDIVAKKPEYEITRDLERLQGTPEYADSYSKYKSEVRRYAVYMGNGGNLLSPNWCVGGEEEDASFIIREMEKALNSSSNKKEVLMRTKHLRMLYGAWLKGIEDVRKARKLSMHMNYVFCTNFNEILGNFEDAVDTLKYLNEKLAKEKERSKLSNMCCYGETRESYINTLRGSPEAKVIFNNILEGDVGESSDMLHNSSETEEKHHDIIV